MTPSPSSPLQSSAVYVVVENAPPCLRAHTFAAALAHLYHYSASASHASCSKSWPDASTESPNTDCSTGPAAIRIGTAASRSSRTLSPVASQRRPPPGPEGQRSRTGRWGAAAAAAAASIRGLRGAAHVAAPLLPVPRCPRDGAPRSGRGRLGRNQTRGGAAPPSWRPPLAPPPRRNPRPPAPAWWQPRPRRSRRQTARRWAPLVASPAPPPTRPTAQALPPALAA